MATKNELHYMKSFYLLPKMIELTSTNSSSPDKNIEIVKLNVTIKVQISIGFKKKMFFANTGLGLSEPICISKIISPILCVNVLCNYFF
jgi:hypothetical protein